MRRLAALLVLLLPVLAVRAQEAPRDSVSSFAEGRGVLAPLTRLAHQRLEECSGLLHLGGAWWAHNDSGDGPFLFRSDNLEFSPAERLAVPGAKAVDWEDIAALDGDLLACDVGDNERKRDDITLYRVRCKANPDQTHKLELAATYPVRYPDQAHDCEAVTVIGGKVHLVTKDRTQSGVTRVFRLAELKDGQANTLEAAGTLDLPAGTMITGADCSAEGKVVLLSYTRLFVYAADKFSGAPEFSCRIDAQQCEAVALQGNRLVFANEQREVFAVNDFFARMPSALMPAPVAVTLPFEEASYEPDGTGAAWKGGAAALALRNLAEGEYLRWMLAGPRLMVAGRLCYEGGFVSSSEKGARLGSGLLLMFGREDADNLTGSEVHVLLGDNGITGLDAWTLSLAPKLALKPLGGLKAAGKVEGGVMQFEVSLPADTVLGAGKLPETFRFNVWGRNLHGELEVSLAGSSFVTATRPYTWATATLKTK